MRLAMLPTIVPGIPPHALLLGGVLLALAGVSATAAAESTPQELVLVVEARDTTCALPQPSDAGAQMARVHWLSPALRESYQQSDATALAQVEAVLDDTLRAWAHGEFVEALEHSAALLPTLHHEASYDGTPTHEALQRAAQLRLVLLLLEGRENDARLEADLLLSRHPAARYCEAGDYPESCALLRERERALPWTWDHIAGAQLHELAVFAHARGGQLLHLELRGDTALIHVPTSTHPPLRDGELCNGDRAFDTAETRWRAHLLEMERLHAPEPKRAASWTLVGVSAALLTSALVSAAILGPRKARLERCLQTSVGCEGVDTLANAHDEWLRSSRATIALSVTAVIGAASIYPARRLESHMQRRRDDAGTLRSELHTLPTIDAEAVSSVSDGLAPE